MPTFKVVVGLMNCNQNGCDFGRRRSSEDDEHYKSSVDDAVGKSTEVDGICEFDVSERSGDDSF